MKLIHGSVTGVLMTLFMAPAVSAQVGSAEWLSPRVGEAKLSTDYSFTTSFNEPVARQGVKMHMSQHNFRLSFPVWQDEGREWSLQARLKALDIESDARLPHTWDRFPDDLWDIQVGTTYRHRFDNGWIGGANLTLGSPSDRPFASGDEILVASTGFLRVPVGEHDAWLFSLNYANNRDFLPHVPLPGVAYQYRPNERLRVLAGLPITAIKWTPLEKLTLEASYFIPRTVRASVGFDLLETLQLYAGFDWANQRFFRYDRRDDDDRLFYFEKRVALGARWDIRDNLSLDLSGGWAFDRFWFEGEDYRDRGDNRLDLSDGPFVKLQLSLRM